MTFDLWLFDRTWTFDQVKITFKYWFSVQLIKSSKLRNQLSSVTQIVTRINGKFDLLITFNVLINFIKGYN